MSSGHAGLVYTRIRYELDAFRVRLVDYLERDGWSVTHLPLDEAADFVATRGAQEMVVALKLVATVLQPETLDRWLSRLESLSHVYPGADRALFLLAPSRSLTIDAYSETERLARLNLQVYLEVTPGEFRPLGDGPDDPSGPK